MKLFTTAAGIDLLKPDFELRTTVYARGNVDPSGTLEGDVKIVGHGDPTIGGRFHDNHATAVIDEGCLVTIVRTPATVTTFASYGESGDKRSVRVTRGRRCEGRRIAASRASQRHESPAIVRSSG